MIVVGILITVIVYSCCLLLLFTIVVAVSMSSVNVYTKQLCLDGTLPETQNGPPLPKLTHQQQQQEYKVTSPTTGQTRQHSTKHAQTKERIGSDASSSDTPRCSSAVPTMDLYSLSSFLSALLAQERILWDRNELLMKSFKSEKKNKNSCILAYSVFRCNWVYICCTFL